MQNVQHRHTKMNRATFNEPAAIAPLEPSLH